MSTIIPSTKGDDRMETWKYIDGFEGMYEVSNCGRIKTLKKKEHKIVRLIPDNKGYYRYSLYKNGKNYTVKIHRLVAQHFIPNPDNKPQVNHINGIKIDNRVENLEWMTNEENMHHSKINNLRKGKMPSCEKHKNAKLTNKDVEYIRQNYKKNCRQFGGDALAKLYGVHISTIIDVVNRKTYSSI